MINLLTVVLLISTKLSTIVTWVNTISMIYLVISRNFKRFYNIRRITFHIRYICNLISVLLSLILKEDTLIIQLMIFLLFTALVFDVCILYFANKFIENNS